MTPTQRLAEHLLGRSLAEYIAEKRNARPRWSWQLIAEQLAEDTAGQVSVSHEAVRNWHADFAAENAA